MEIKNIRAFVEKLNASAPPKSLLDIIVVSRTDGLSLACIKGNPTLEALATNATNFLEDSLNTSGSGGLGNYYLLDMPSNLTAVVLVTKGYWCGLMVNKANMTLGLLFNVLLPQAIQDFKEAVQ